MRSGDIRFSHSFKRIQNPARHCKYPECPVSILKQQRLSGARQRFMQAYRKNSARQTHARHGAMANLKTPACRHALDTLKITPNDEAKATGGKLLPDLSGHLCPERHIAQSIQRISNMANRPLWRADFSDFQTIDLTGSGRYFHVRRFFRAAARPAPAQAPAAARPSSAAPAPRPA